MPPTLGRRLTIRPAIALPLDLACLSAFVLAGRQSHDTGGGISWFLTVLWPFVAGWIVAGSIFGVYKPGAAWWRIVAAVIGCVAIAMPLRALITGRGIAPTFVIVAMAFNLLFIFGWRAVSAIWLKIA